ncbi:MAG: hypothetical protein M3Y76_08740 [Chloroflexota bacterium]|nr:hypothetical protein [Chloroflexota bacterium]
MNEKIELASEQGLARLSIQNGGVVAGASEASLAKEMLDEVPEARSIRVLLLIQQYTALRSEIEKRIDIRQQILALTLLVAGTFLTVGAQPNVPAVVLLFYPIIAMFLGAIWEHNDLRVGQINFYIRTEVEKHLGSLGPGWETFRQQMFSTSNRKQSRRSTEQRHPLTPQVGLIVFATRGMFFTTQATTIIVAAVRYISEFLQHGFAINLTEPKQAVLIIATGMLFLGDIGILIYTFSVVQHKRG